MGKKKTSGTNGKSTTRIRVEYSHTDKMGIVHHSQYLVYCEFARMEYMRTHGVTYKDIEDSGVIMPVVSACTEYKRSAYFDDQLTIQTEAQLVDAKIIFRHRIYNVKQELLTTSEIHLVCMNELTRKPIKPLQILIKNLLLN